MFKKVDHIAIAVRNLEESKKDFKTEKCGIVPEKMAPPQSDVRWKKSKTYRFISFDDEVSNLPGRCCRRSLPQPPGHDKGCRQNKL